MRPHYKKLKRDDSVKRWVARWHERRRRHWLLSGVNVAELHPH